VAGAAHPLVEAIGPLLSRIGADAVDPDELRSGDVPIAWDGVVVAGIRLAPTPSASGQGSVEPSTSSDGGLDGILADLEREFDGPLAELSRSGKQQAVRMLEESGAFSYRKSVETVAAALGVTRFTVYNYLNRDRDQGVS